MTSAREEDVARGSPAWAGIDPRFDGIADKAERFPRVGGDRPGKALVATDGDAVPPRGRG